MCYLSCVPFSHYPFHFVYYILTCITTFELPYGSAFMKIKGELSRKKVDWEGYSSEMIDITVGSPQGSVISPLLFLIMTSNLEE
jgi:hypothetical protein